MGQKIIVLTPANSYIIGMFTFFRGKPIDHLIQPGDGRRFNLSRSFLAVSLLSICLASAVSGTLLSQFLTDRMLARDADVTRDFVQSVVQIELAKGYGLDHPAARTNLLEFFKHIGAMPDVVRANVYARDKTLLWSSDDQLLPGKRLGANPELDEALEGHVEIETGVVGEEDRPKDEHFSLGASKMHFVETYIPIRELKSRAIVGVVEYYRTPNALFEAIHAGQRLIWLIALGAGIFLYLTLFWMVRRADQVIRFQQMRLIESETMGAVGEMASAVAHGVRNPLASIRSSAELLQDEVTNLAAESAADIISEVDRMEKWVRELLTYSQPQDYKPEAVDLAAVILQSTGGYAREARRRKVALDTALPLALPKIRGNAALLIQVCNNLVSNALEAMPDHGGEVKVSAAAESGGQQVVVVIRDTGAGIAAADIDRILQPFFTTKPKGLGVGLTLANRIVKRFGGALHIASKPGQGTTVTLTFLTAS
jgi:signal transduction histidine kinase